MSSRRASTLTVVVVSQCAGLLILAMLLPALPDAMPSPSDLLWGAAAGAAGGTGVALLYAALAVGTMSVVAPITAACAVMIPVAAELLTGARPSLQVSGGIALAIVAITLVSQSGEQSSSTSEAHSRLPPGVGLALLSGVAIGVFFLALARTDESAGLWPLLVARMASVSLFGVGALVRRIPFTLDATTLLITVAAGALDMVANGLYLLATRGGELSAVVTLSSLYPASTVVMARFVLGERLSLLQAAGIVCALVAVVLIVQ